MNAVRAKLGLLRSLGPAWALWRLTYAFRKGSGLLKHGHPAIPWDHVTIDHLVTPGTPTAPEEFRVDLERHSGRFFFRLGKLPDATTLRRIMGERGIARTIAVADDYCRGRFLCYSQHPRNLGRPVNWLMNPFTGSEHHARVHWCDYPTFSKELGDVKDVWEPSRFACAYWLVRAYAITGDEKYPVAFWEMFADWCRQNPPNMGPNWKCGQETAIRVFAFCFALHGFWGARATTASLLVDMVKMLALHAERIAGNIGYAVSQKNNHGLSEAIGLITVGLLFPQLRGASHWHRTGRNILEREVRRQVYDDGSFVQHSMNYHRVMLHDCLWAVRLAEINGQSFSEELIRRVRLAGEFLCQMIDVESGGVPNYGANDGALVLPLTACDYSDFRPTVQAAGYLTTGRRILADGPWDEMILWSHGTEALRSPLEKVSLVSRRFDAGGYYTLRGADSWCMIRCHTYHDRPAHVDPLHVDLWHKGVNLLSDSGTYKYYSPDEPNMEQFFKDIAAHNTIEIDGRGPLELVSHFLWLPWPRAKCLEHGERRWRGEHYAYDRSPWNVIHRRAVELVDDSTWVITDEVLGMGTHNIALRWHLCDGRLTADARRRRVEIEQPPARATLFIEAPAEVQLDAQRGVSTVDRVAGWESRYYSEHDPRPTIEAHGQCLLPLKIRTRIQLGSSDIK